MHTLIENKKVVVSDWVDKYSDTLFGYALTRVKNKEQAEDLVQEVFVIAFKSFESFNQGSSPQTWLIAILKNKIIDYYRGLSKGKEVNSEIDSLYFNSSDSSWDKKNNPESWNDYEEHLLDNPAFNAIMKLCMEHLPGKWFAAIQAKYIKDKKAKDICQDMGITSSNYWQMIHRAKLQLRSCLDEHWTSI